MIIPCFKADIDQILKEPNYVNIVFQIYDYLIDSKEGSYKDEKKEKLEFLASFRTEVIKLLTPTYYDLFKKEATTLLHKLFIFYATYEDYYIEGLKFFSLFEEILKERKYNPIKAYLFYFAYQTKKFNTKEVKDILSQTLINAEITDNRSYLDFCMYCFYRGIYYLEKRDYYMTTYYYCVAVQMGLKAKHYKFLNGFSCQMIRSLCFLKILTNFKIKEALSRESRFRQFDDPSSIDHEDVSYCLNFINKNKVDLKEFKEFIKEEQENIKKCSLQGLKQAAEEELIFKILKEVLTIYKRIKMTKIAQLKQLEIKDIMRVLKKKVMEGEINLKYDESEDIIETFDVDPGLKERVKKTSELFEKIIDGNKNMFVTLKIKKAEQLEGKSSPEDVSNIIANGNEEEMMMGMDEEFDE